MRRAWVGRPGPIRSAWRLSALRRHIQRSASQRPGGTFAYSASQRFGVFFFPGGGCDSIRRLAAVVSDFIGIPCFISTSIFEG